MLCRKCGIREVPPRQTSHPGRPRTTCLICNPVRRLSEEEKIVQRERVRLSRERRRAAGNEPDFATTLCGCDRDYLAVPLEDSHRCPYPRPLPRAA